MGELVWVYHATTSRCVVGSFQIFAGKATTHLARHGRTWPRPESSDQTPTLNLANHIIAHLCKFISAIFNETQKNGRVPQQKQSYKTIKHTYIYIYICVFPFTPVVRPPPLPNMSKNVSPKPGRWGTLPWPEFIS